MSTTPPRIVFLSPSLPLRAPRHAGGLLQKDVTESLLRQGAAVRVIAPAFRSSLDVLSDVVDGCAVHMPELEIPRRGLRGIAVRLAHRMNGRAGRALLQCVHPPFLVALLLHPRIWRDLRSADVIDLQWFAQIRLVRIVRLLAGRRPVLIGTFHDVVSQRLERAALVESSPRTQERKESAARRARHVERRAGRGLDTAVVLSDKDRALLVDSGVAPARILVLAPRLEAPDASVLMPEGRAPAPPADPVTAPTVLFVGYLRRLENHDAALWLLRDIWPRVLEKVPGARLRIVGGGVKPALEETAARSPGRVELAGFVDDLWTEYAAASCSVIPLRDGAGVKFKTIESLLAGVPTVATAIGAEGVGVEEDFVTISESPARLADGIVTALTDPAAREHAQEAGRRLRDRHGSTAFDRAVAQIYRL